MDQPKTRSYPYLPLRKTGPNILAIDRTAYHNHDYRRKEAHKQHSQQQLQFLQRLLLIKADLRINHRSIQYGTR